MEGRGEGGNGGIPNGEDEVSPWKHNRGCGGESSSARQGKKMSMRHTRVIVTHYGGPDALRVVEEECPEPKDGEVRVRVLAAGGSFHLEEVVGKPVGIRVTFSPLSKFSKGIRLHAGFPLLRTVDLTIYLWAV